MKFATQVLSRQSKLLVLQRLDSWEATVGVVEA